VASVHARALNLVLDTGPVLALLPEGTPVHPWALVVALDSQAFAALGAALERGVVRTGKRGLRVGSLGVEYEVAEVAELHLRHRPAAVPAAAVQLLAQVAATAPRDGAFDLPLTAALERFERGGPAADLARVVGLGEGFTPAGDDALVGILAGLDLASTARVTSSGLRAALVAALPHPLEERTTRLAAQMLAAAADGLYAEPVLQLLEALSRSEAFDSHHPALQALLRMGQRSGLDTLRGLVAALQRPEPENAR
jgi:hypothetical protein